MKPVRYTSADFDHFVALLIGRWEETAHMRQIWSSLSEEEQAFETEDWPVNNDIHRRLADYVADHRLTEHQQAQWARLQQLVDRHLKDLREMGYRVRIPDTVKRRVVA